MNSCYLKFIEKDLFFINIKLIESSTEIVEKVTDNIDCMGFGKGHTLKIYGNFSPAIAFAIANCVLPLFITLAVYDPELEAYLVVVSHNPDLQIGRTIARENWYAIDLNNEKTKVAKFKSESEAEEFVNSQNNENSDYKIVFA